MLGKYTPLVLLSFALAVILLMTGFIFFASNRFHKEVPLTDERELKVTLEAGLGKINISKGKSSVILDAEVETDQHNDLTEFIKYSVRDRIGYLSVDTDDGREDEDRDTKKKHSIHFSGFESNSWDMRFTDAVPISFDIELGLGKGVLDLSGLDVKDLDLSAGVSSVYLKFDKKNRSVIEDLTIESGLSKFKAEGLCNANFNHLKFEGGLGSYSLDFGGELKKEVDVDIEVGVGELTITIPENIGLHIICEKSWLAHLDIDRDLTEDQEDNYYSPNYRNARGRMNMRIEAGLGSVKIRRK